MYDSIKGGDILALNYKLAEIQPVFSQPDESMRVRKFRYSHKTQKELIP